MPNMLLEISGKITPEENEEKTEPKQKQHPAVDMISDGSKSNAVKSNIA